MATTLAASAAHNNQIVLFNDASADELMIQIRCATSLGWAMTELLGRCIVLKEVLEKKHLTPPDFQRPVILSPIRDQRERARTVMGRILFLAKQLEVAGCEIEDKIKKYGSVLEPGKCYTDVLNNEVNALCDGTISPTYTETCTRINMLLFYWNEQIQVRLQEKPPAVYNGYTVGRGFATIRWYIGIGLAKPKMYHPYKKGDDRLTTVHFFGKRLFALAHKEFSHQDHQEIGDYHDDLANHLISDATLDKLLDHLQSMSSYLPPLVPQALEYSLFRWGRAIIKHPEALSKKVGNKGARSTNHPWTNPLKALRQEVSSRNQRNMKRALIKQATIWHDLLTGERDPTTFVDPRQITKRFILKIFIFSIPFILFGFLLAAAIVVTIIFLQSHLANSTSTTGITQQTQSITNTITSSIIALITAASTIPVIRTLWIWGSNTATDFVNRNQNNINTVLSTTGKNALELYWQRSQQEAVNKKTFVSPRSQPRDVDDGD
jgi:hypothetical protein